MTTSFKAQKRNWFLFISGYFIGGYLLINWINLFRTRYFDVSIPFEQSIPFVPAFIFGYILVYFGMFALYFLISDEGELRTAVVSFMIMTTIHYVLFLIFPVKYTMRPDLSSTAGVGIEVTRLCYFLDKPHNCFPSLHVAYPTLATLVLWPHHRYARVVYLVMTIIVAVSVILVKQHYILDVVAGSLAAGVVYGVCVGVRHRGREGVGVVRQAI